LGFSFVVLFDSFFGEVLYLVDIGVQVGDQNVFTVHAVVSFDLTVLHRPAGLNKLNLNAVFLPLPLKLFGSEFRAAVGSDNPRIATPSDNAF
jgi:hypothetical protein